MSSATAWNCLGQGKQQTPAQTQKKVWPGFSIDSGSNEAGLNQGALA